MTSIDLGSAAGVGWGVRPVSGPGIGLLGTEPLLAVVPGEIHPDLRRAGAIPDPFDGDNEEALEWIGRTAWRYEARFDAPGLGDDRIDLVFDGLDTVASVRLNGRPVARTRNQHRSYRFDVTALVCEGGNELVVEFAAPLDAAEEAERRLGRRSHANLHPYNAIRKMACAYGWDWGIDAPGVGIWRPVRLEQWSGVRIGEVRPLATWADGGGSLEVELLLEHTAPCSGTIAVSVLGLTATARFAPGAERASVLLDVPGAAPWWPRGHGEPALHDVVVVVEPDAGDGDVWTGAVGFRTVELRTQPDAEGTSFELIVNGRPIYVKGVNWIPDSAFVSQVGEADYRERLADATQGGANLVRVWGGGVFEADAFYEICDRSGLLVWQDFLFACAAYSEDPELAVEVEAESREAVARLCRHPSLVLWNGSNENVWGYVDWRWSERARGVSWGEGYYRDLLPAIVAELDPRAPYMPSSPYSFERYAHPNDPDRGSSHLWSVWNEAGYEHYRDSAPRFASEFGFQGPPAWSTLRSVVHDEPSAPDGPQLLRHQKAVDGMAKLDRGLHGHLPAPVGMDDWHWAMQLNQARAVATGIEHLRSLFPRNTGGVVWQLNDSWPVISWAAVDAAGIRKPLWFALRRAYADRVLLLVERDAGSAVVAHNDSDVAWRAQVSVARRSVGESGAVLAREVVAIDVPARAAVSVPLSVGVATPGDPAAEYLVARSEDGVIGYRCFVEDVDLRLADTADALVAEAAERDGGYEVVVRARAFVKDLMLFPDRLDPAARVGSGLVTLEAGESHRFVVSAAAGLARERLTRRPVLRSAADLLPVTGSAVPDRSTPAR